MKVYNREWERRTQGRGFDFEATDEQIQTILCSALPDEYGPYTLIGILTVLDGHNFTRTLIEAPVDEFCDLRAKNIWKCFLKEKALS